MIKVYHIRDLFKNYDKTMALMAGKDTNTSIRTILELKPEDFILVAEVNTDSLEEAYALTNSTRTFWGDNPGVTFMGPNAATFFQQARSTSVGDLLETKDGKFYMVDNIGFLEIPDRKLIEAPLDEPMNMGIHPAVDQIIERKLKEAPAEKDSTYVVHHPEHGLWTGNGWGTQTEARQYDDPDAAQDQADALSLAALEFKHDAARAADAAGTLEFTVRGFQSGKRHIPKPLVDKPKHLFVREGHRERNQK